jgi:hypothetical protein
MLTIAWLFIKLSFSRLIPFILKYWLVILFCLICWYAYTQKAAHERSVQELVTFKADIAKATAKQAQENEIERTKAESAVKSSQLIHTRQIEEIKNAYAKSNKVSNLTISDLRNRLREQLSDTVNLPEVDANTERTAEEWRERYTTIVRQYDALKQGCAITTSDFNSCRDWADTACLQVGCE